MSRNKDYWKAQIQRDRHLASLAAASRGNAGDVPTPSSGTATVAVSRPHAIIDSLGPGVGAGGGSNPSTSGGGVARRVVSFSPSIGSSPSPLPAELEDVEVNGELPSSLGPIRKAPSLVKPASDLSLPGRVD